MSSSQAQGHWVATRNSRHYWSTIGIVLCMTVGFVLDASCQTAASSNWWASGRAALASNDIITANNDFSNAVVASATDPDANFFYAFTRVAVLPSQPDVSGLLDGFNVSTNGRNLWHWTADFQRNLFNQIVLPPNSPTEAVVLGVLTNTVLPEITGAIANFSQLPTNYTVTISNELNRTNPTVVPYSRVLMFQAMLQAAQASILTISSYNLNITNASALLSDIYARTVDFSNDVLAAYPQLLVPSTGAASTLPQAGNDLNEAISTYVSGQHLEDAQNGVASHTNFVHIVQQVQAALSGPAAISLRHTSSVMVNLTHFFSSSPLNLASLAPQTLDDPLSGLPRIFSGTFPDPTVGEVLPDFTQQSWVNLLGSPAMILSGDTNWNAAVFGRAGLDCDAYAMAVSGTNVYVGGCFYTAGATNNYVNGIAVWNGSSWSPLGSGVSGPYGAYVSALAVSGTNVYVGGAFTNAGGVAANNIAVWDGTRWSALGSQSGFPFFVRALAVSGNNLYAGGYSTNGVDVVDLWNGSSWSALGSGGSGEFGGYINAMAVSGNDLYVGGSFTNVGSVAANNIAMWNGSSWSALAGGVSGSYKGGFLGNVEALAVRGTNLYVGGVFTNAGGMAANNIAVWNGTSWSALGGGVGGNVGAMALSGTNLYVGGGFTNAEVVLANDVAVWDGSSWSALGGSGIGTANDDANGNEFVEAMGTDGTNLFVGGYFGSAGGWKASNIALWHGTGAPVPCEVSPDSTSASFSAAGGSSNVVVTANEANCAWTAVSNDRFIRIISGGSGPGDGTVTYSVATNASTVPVTGTMTIAGQTFTVTEGASACSVSPASTNASFTAAGGSGAVTVTANGTNCVWTAASNSGFITIISGTNGTGSGTVHYSVASNTSSNEVTGTMTIAGQTFTVVQSGVGCNFSVASTGASFNAAGGSGAVTVTASATNCSWGAASNDSFITITSGSSSTGNGTVSYSVAANSGAARAGTMTIAGQTFTVDQIGASSVSYSLGSVVQKCKTKINKKTEATNTTCTVAFNLVVTNTGATTTSRSSVLFWLGQGSTFNADATGAPVPLKKTVKALKAGKSVTIKMKSKKLTGDQAGTFIFATDSAKNVLAFAPVPSS